MPSSNISQGLDDLQERLLQGIQTVEPLAVECFEGTRARILVDIATKTDNRDSPNVIWISGSPGSGKSSLSLTVKSRLRRLDRLVTYFRFDRNEAATTTPTALWRQVAYDLSRRLPSIPPMLFQRLRDDEVDLNSPLDVFTSLVEEPLLKFTRPLDHPLVIIIDGLDECGGHAHELSPDRRLLLQTIRRWSRLPKHFKLLVTSREEDDITRFLPRSICSRIIIPTGRLLTEDPHAQSSFDVLNDIRIFLESRFQIIRKRFTSLPLGWPGANTRRDMATRGFGNFMWTTAAVDFIGSGMDVEDRLRKIMKKPSRASSTNPLYSLYTNILEISFGDVPNDDSESDVLRSVLGLIVLAKRPLDDAEYMKLPTIDPGGAAYIVGVIRGRLFSVVAPGPLRFIHKSFDDFLLSEECPSKYRIRMTKSQHLLVQLCVTTMTEGLHFNMCNLEMSSSKNMDVPDIETRIASAIPSLLSYSCCFFAHHLVQVPFDERLMDEIKTIILHKLLYWFEVMSLVKKMDQVSRSLLMLLEWSRPSPDTDFKNFVRDARQFIAVFGQPIGLSVPFIYISALPLAPKNSLVARHFLLRFPSLLSLSPRRATDWPSCIFTSEHHRFGVNSVAFSPDGKYFVSGSDDATIHIRDSETGGLVSGPFRVDSPVMRVFFTSGGRCILAACRNGHVASWDVATGHQYLYFQAGHIVGYCSSSGGQRIISMSVQGGRPTLTLWDAESGVKLHDSPIDETATLVVFSRDGSYMAQTGLFDTNVRLSKLVEGNRFKALSHPPPRFQHKKRISALSFSADGKFVVSGSKDGSILIWDARTGEVTDRPLLTGTTEVNAVAYSPKTQLIISSSGESTTVMVWNASTHEQVLGPFDSHTSQINDIAISDDGTRALTASLDKTVRMWDLATKEIGSIVLTHGGRAAGVRCVVFSPWGEKLASLDERTIRVWDSKTGKPLLDPINTGSIYGRIIFSLDGSLIVAYNSYDGTLRGWNVQNGELSFRQDLKGDELEYTYVEHVSFRSTDHRILTCSDQGIVRVWSLEAGAMTEDLSASSRRPIGASGPAKIIALSSDGSTAIVRDYNRNPCHYMWSTTAYQPLRLTLIDDEDISGPIAYSPSGDFFAATSCDDDEWVIRVWEAHTGKISAGPFTVNGIIDCLAFSPDDRHIVFHYSESVEFWIWDVRTVCPTSGPWAGHGDTISSLAFSPDGGRLASGSAGGQIKIWNTADLDLPPPAPSVFSEVGTRVQDGWIIDAQGNVLFCASEDYVTRLRQLPRDAEESSTKARNDLDPSKARVTSLNGELRTTSRSLGPKEGDFLKVENKLKNTELKLNGAEQELLKMTSALRSTEAKLKIAEGGLSATKEKLGHTEQEFLTTKSGLENKLTAAEIDLNTTKGKLRTAEGVLSMAKDRLQAAEGKLRIAMGDLATTRDKLACKEQELHTTKSDLETRLSTAEGDLKTAEDDLILAKDELRNAGQKLLGTRSELVAKIKYMEDRLRTTREMLSSAEGDLSTVRGRLRTMEGDFASTTDRLRIAEGDLVSTKEKLKTAESNLTSTNHKLRATEGELISTKDKLKNAGGELISTKDKLKNAEGDLTSTKDRLKAMDVELNTARGKLRTVEGVFASTRDRLKITEGKLTSTEDKLKSAETNLTSTSHKLRTTEGELTSTKDKLKNAEGDLTSTKGKLKLKEAELSTTRVELRTVEGEFASTKDRLKIAVNDLTSTMEKLRVAEGGLNMMQGKLRIAEGDLISTKDRLKNTEGDLESTKDQLKTAEGDLNTTREMLGTAKDDLTSTRVKLRDTERELLTTKSRLESGLKAAENDLRAMREKLRASEGYLNTTRDRLQTVESDLNTSKGKLSLTEEKLESTATDLGSAVGELNATKDELRQTKGDLEAAQNNMDLVRRRWRSMEGHLNNTKDKLNSAEEEIEGLRARATVQDVRIKEALAFEERVWNERIEMECDRLKANLAFEADAAINGVKEEFLVKKHDAIEKQHTEWKKRHESRRSGGSLTKDDQRREAELLAALNRGLKDVGKEWDARLKAAELEEKKKWETMEEKRLQSLKDEWTPRKRDTLKTLERTLRGQ